MEETCKQRVAQTDLQGHALSISGKFYTSLKAWEDCRQASLSWDLHHWEAAARNFASNQSHALSTPQTTAG